MSLSSSMTDHAPVDEYGAVCAVDSFRFAKIPGILWVVSSLKVTR